MYQPHFFEDVSENKVHVYLLPHLKWTFWKKQISDADLQQVSKNKIYSKTLILRQIVHNNDAASLSIQIIGELLKTSPKISGHYNKDVIILRRPLCEVLLYYQIVWCRKCIYECFNVNKTYEWNHQTLTILSAYNHSPLIRIKKHVIVFKINHMFIVSAEWWYLIYKQVFLIIQTLSRPETWEFFICKQRK